MDDEKAIKKILKTVEENNRIVRNLQSSMRWSRFFRIVYWVVILAIMFGAYYWIQPYVDNLLNVYSGVQEVGSSFPNVKGLLGQ